MSTMPVSQPNQVHRIVAGFDGSTSSETALRWALAEARRWGGELDVVAAWRYPAEWAEGFNEKWADDEAALAQRARVSAQMPCAVAWRVANRPHGCTSMPYAAPPLECWSSVQPTPTCSSSDVGVAGRSAHCWGRSAPHASTTPSAP